MDYTSYIYIAIALLPFLLWGAILFAYSSSQEDAPHKSAQKSDASTAPDESYSDNVVIIPYGLIFPLYYRSPASARDFG